MPVKITTTSRMASAGGNDGGGTGRDSGSETGRGSVSGSNIASSSSPGNAVSSTSGTLQEDSIEGMHLYFPLQILPENYIYLFLDRTNQQQH